MPPYDPKSGDVPRQHDCTVRDADTKVHGRHTQCAPHAVEHPSVFVRSRCLRAHPRRHFFRVGEHGLWPVMTTRSRFGS